MRGRWCYVQHWVRRSTDRAGTGRSLGVGGDAEADVAGTAVGRVRAARVDAVPPAVALMAQVAAAAHHPGDTLAGPDRGPVGRAAVRVRRKPVGAPLPHVARRFEEPEVVGGVGA